MKRFLLTLGLLVAGCAVDADEDGFPEADDCDDTDADRFPGAEEVCDGLDTDCANGADFVGGEVDTDGDGYLACAECDDSRADHHPEAAPTCDATDADCDGEVSAEEEALPGDSATCPAVSCVTLRDDRPELGTGSFWIDGGLGRGAARVDCEQEQDGGGWIRLRLADNDGVLVGSSSADNPWHKCADDVAAPYPWLDDETTIPQDFAGGGLHEVTLSFARPSDGGVYSNSELAILRAVVSELHPETRMVATTADDDGNSWQDGDGGGMEVYIAGSDGRWRTISPGTNGECGGAGGSWPAEDSESAFYVWSTDAGLSSSWGDTGLEAPIGALAPEEILPVIVQLAVFTGGGVSFGYEARELLVR